MWRKPFRSGRVQGVSKHHLQVEVLREEAGVP